MNHSPTGGTLGLIAAGLGSTEILDPICAEVTRFSESRGYTLFRGETSAGDIDSEDFTIEQADVLAARYIDRGVQGVYFAPLEMPKDHLAVNRQIATKLRAAGIAVVLLDRDIEEFGSRGSCDLVGIDSFAAGFTLGVHLAETGRRRIRFFAMPHYPSTANLRSAGLFAALRQARLRQEFTDIIAGDPTDLKLVRRMLDIHYPDAIVCANDRTAAVLMQTLSSLGMAVPQSIAIAGFDDIRYVTLLSVPLTTMQQPCRDIGLGAVNLMAERLNTPSLPSRTLSYSANLVVRASTSSKISK